MKNVFEYIFEYDNQDVKTWNKKEISQMSSYYLFSSPRFVGKS